MALLEESGIDRALGTVAAALVVPSQMSGPCAVEVACVADIDTPIDTSRTHMYIDLRGLCNFFFAVLVRAGMKEIKINKSKAEADRVGLVGRARTIVHVKRRGTQKKAN